MLTRCPACASCYRVVPDQLRVSLGWVRCGQCSEVFEAQVNKIEPFVLHAPVSQESPVATLEPDAVSPRGLECESNATPSPSPSVVEIADADHVPDVVDPTPDADDPMADLNHFADEFADEPAVNGDLVIPPLVATRSPASDIPGPDEWTQPERSEPDVPDKLLDFGQTLSEKPEGKALEPSWSSDVDPEKLSFLAARSDAAPTRPKSVLWSLVLMALLLSLGAQWGIQQRDDLVTKFPQTRPVLDWTCRVLGCRLMAVRDIDALVIDASSLTVAGESGYLMSLKIRNKSLHPVAFPAVELTLIDALDQVLVRKVVRPEEMQGTRPEPIGAGAALDLRWGLVLREQSPKQRVVGYRLTTFYL